VQTIPRTSLIPNISIFLTFSILGCNTLGKRQAGRWYFTSHRVSVKGVTKGHSLASQQIHLFYSLVPMFMLLTNQSAWIVDCYYAKCQHCSPKWDLLHNAFILSSFHLETTSLKANFWLSEWKCNNKMLSDEKLCRCSMNNNTQFYCFPLRFKKFLRFNIVNSFLFTLQDWN